MNLLSKIYTTAAMTIALGAPVTLNAQEVTLSFHQFQPDGSILAKNVFTPWIENVEAASDGRIKIEMSSGSAAAGNPAQLIGLAEDGTVDIAMSLTGYTPGRFIRSEVFELPFMMQGTVATSLAFQQLIEEDFQNNEYSTMHVLAGFVHSPGQIHTKDPVTSLDDIAGKDLRAPTRIIGNLLTELGANAVSMPLPLTGKGLSDGTINGTVTPWEQVRTTKGIVENVGHHTEFEGNESFYTATLVVVMNKAKYDAMPDDLKAILDAQSGMALSRLAATELQKGDAAGRALAVETGNPIYTIPTSDIAKWKSATTPVQITWADEAAISGIEGWGLLDYAREVIRETAIDNPS
ncbi:TRAP-type C4-dicarboxylate transport system substrate-binding protein [Pacificibacter maritimus]|uniref:TRAP-type C4-dicarboxylate transport system substrate-binding protein n=1 Tax=Pacificibacter maritimus TaxID=762213 RepID=A0A3N4UNX6_9RHOB|nr:TRAP transporter substrate-binding protein [Pacificibacter maritimus]RPE71728.1 TRAP-type C4-dicarboxylate transport system substrate-binding protein [Pacificibacter maritimus]